MVPFLRLFGLVTLAWKAAVAVRLKRVRESAKFIVGVPVLNYHLSRGGQESLSELNQEEEWVVVLESGTSDAQIEKACMLSKNPCKASGHPSGGGVPFLEVRGAEGDLATVLVALKGAAKFVEPDVMMAPVPEIEGVDGEGARNTNVPWGLEKVGATSRPREGRGVHIYVVDTGIRASHTDFGGRVIPTLDLTSGSPVLCNGQDISCAMDQQGHGTHCAGTAAGTTYGVAPQATLHSVRVFGSGDSPFSWSYQALDYISTKGERPAVTSMSLGGKGQLSAMKEAVDAAVASGVTVVVAGGNDNADSCDYSPAFVPSAITVGATNKGGGRSVFSNFGACVNLWAPGTEVVSASQANDIGSKVLSGTSMACPHVSGGAALVLEASPSLSPSSVFSTLSSTAAKGAVLVGLGGDDTNKFLWVGAGSAPPPPQKSCPGFARTPSPDADGDCGCPYGERCYQDGAYGCTWSRGANSASYFLFTCTTCKCL